MQGPAVSRRAHLLSLLLRTGRAAHAVPRDSSRPAPHRHCTCDSFFCIDILPPCSALTNDLRVEHPPSSRQHMIGVQHGALPPQKGQPRRCKKNAPIPLHNPWTVGAQKNLQQACRRASQLHRQRWKIGPRRASAPQCNVRLAQAAVEVQHSRAQDGTLAPSQGLLAAPGAAVYSSRASWMAPPNHQVAPPGYATAGTL